jgi:AcrR family transcriptional regulator
VVPNAKNSKCDSRPVRGGDAVRRALVEATAGALAEAGPSAVSVREVARVAGVNHGQIHHYFGGKRGLLKAAMHHLASIHLAHATENSVDGSIPRALQIAEDPQYWRAICQCVMEGDLELAGLEVEEGISVPRRALATLMTRLEIPETDLDFKAQFAAVAALQLGWAALEDFVLLISDVDESEREAVRDRVKVIISNWFGPLPAP